MPEMFHMNSTQEFLGEIPTELMPELTKLVQNFLSGKLRERLNAKTLSEFSAEYLAHVKSNLSNKYYLSAKVSLNHLIKFLRPDIRLTDISPREADLFLSEVKKSAPRGYLVYFRTLKSAFSKATVWGYTGLNPFKEIRPGKLQKAKPAVFNDSNLKSILSKIDNKTLQLIVQTSYFSGGRISEVINLKVKNVNMKERLIRIGDADYITKSRKERFVPIPNKLYRLIKPLVKNRGEDDYLFVKSNGFSYSADYISKSFKKAIRKSGLGENYHFHSLRHSYASNLAKRGASPFALKELLGHSSVTTTERYTHTHIEDLYRTVNLLNTNKRKEK